MKQSTKVLQLLAMFFHAHAKGMLEADCTVGGVPLSPRELECLEWSARGKSAWEIGKILGISPGFHRDNARAKLGVRTVRQAVVRLVQAKSRRRRSISCITMGAPKRSSILFITENCRMG
ncbi:helix-turn-helix transcriptional regulator [Bradyrhizobium sp. 14AA]